MDLSKDKDPVVNEKMKKNLVYVSIFSIVMFFAGLSSAYIVLMGDSMWVKAGIPNAFWWSSAFIALSSFSFVYAIKMAKQNELKMLKACMSITLLMGLIFVYFQWNSVDLGFRMRGLKVPICVKNAVRIHLDTSWGRKLL